MAAVTSGGDLHGMALQKMSAILGDRRARELLGAVLAEHAIVLHTADDLAWFAEELAKLGGFEGAVGAMLGLQAAMLGGRRRSPTEAPRRFTLTLEAPAELSRAIDGALSGSASLEDAAQRLAALITGRYTTVPLCRSYAVLPLERLPPPEARFAQRIAAERGAEARLRPDTLVLCLLGTSGADPAWCDRRQSKSHLAIPLLSAELVRGAPMIAAMLAQLHVDLRGFDTPGVIVRRSDAGADGVFYVREAGEATDPVGRRIIPAADFVTSQKIRTVFGVGVTCVDGTLLAVIVFTQELLSRATVEALGVVTEVIKTHTAGPVTAKRLYG